MLQLTHERIRAVKKTECVSYGHVEHCTHYTGSAQWAESKHHPWGQQFQWTF